MLLMGNCFADDDASDWTHYGGNAAGERYVVADQINPGNVRNLTLAWQYRTGDLASKPEAVARSAFEVTPIIIEDQLIFCTPFNEVISLNPVTGAQQWRYDPGIDLQSEPANKFICRGVSYWPGQPDGDAGFCNDRIFMGTNDRRVIALDRASGEPCLEFGTDGMVHQTPSRSLAWEGEFQITSAPTIVHDLVIVGSSISDNRVSDAPRGIVRAFDARTGAERWTFDPIVADDTEWANGSASRTGHTNVWAPMSVDAANDLVFLPTSSPSPDFYGGLRPGNNRYANSLVALRASTGELVWHFQTIHHDVFDYDLPAQPTLTTLRRDGQEIPAVVQATKTGLLFIFNRLTGEPLFEIEERSVPQTDVPGEVTSPTQPVPVKPEPLTQWGMTEDDLWGLTPIDKRDCRQRFRALRSDGIFTPPSLRGSVSVPFTGGGANWGGIAVERDLNIAIVNTSNLAHIIRLIPRKDVQQVIDNQGDEELAAQGGTPYAVSRELFLSSALDLPCNKPPWGQISAVDLNSGEILWQSPFGTTRDLGPRLFGIRLPLPGLDFGTPSLGGPLVTAGGLIFIGAALDNYLRAIDVRTGNELWRQRLPAGPQATPMSYVRNGRQYVVIAAGGHRDADTTMGDYILAFALPR